MSRYGFILLLFACLAGSGASMAQDTVMDEAARRIWTQLGGIGSGGQDFRFDRITRQGELVIYERYQPASFLILKRGRNGFFPAGYSFQNLFFGEGSAPAGQNLLLDALATTGQPDSGRFKGIRTVTSPLGPLLQTRWGQGKYFNYYCPRDARGPNGRVYAGCVAIAMGQILRYYGRFNDFDVKCTYNSGFYGNLSATLGKYDWVAMDNSPVTVDLETSDFLSDLGILLQMSYGPSGSTANNHRTLEAFHELGYIEAVLLRKSKFSMDSWTEVFYQNLSEYKPVLVAGGGHAFVCDGYDLDGLFHFNMGWDGYGDGFYPLAVVMSLPVNDAFTGLEPVSWPRPPRSLEIPPAGAVSSLSWSYDPDNRPVKTRIYADDSLFLETGDTVMDVTRLSPGLHMISVSAVYADGESRWIGPSEVFVRGELLTLDDQALYRIIQKNLGPVSPDNGTFQIYEGDLSRITSLEIDQPITSMEGIRSCNHLRRLIIDGFPGPALDAGPLENLTGLRILEWKGREMLHPEILEKLNQLVELRIRQTELKSLNFLNQYHSLLVLEYSEAPLGSHEVLGTFPMLEQLSLNRTGLADAAFVSGLGRLTILDLAGNKLTGTQFLASLPDLSRADLSGNHITQLLLTEGLNSLNHLDVSDNEINTITIASDLKSLQTLDLSGNKLVTPGRLFIYTPVLKDLNLSGNSIRDMGKQRCQSLEFLDVSENQLIATDWVSLQPSLKKINLEHNRVSDLSGLLKTDLYRQLEFLGLNQNPLSRQSFLEWLPVLTEAVDSISKPNEYQPLSPCYVTPLPGSRVVGQEVELQWVTDTSAQKCVYDLYLSKGDSLVPLILGLDSRKVVLAQRPAAAFSWVVASRTADSVYYSGVYNLVSTTGWTIPFRDGFENYRGDLPVSLQSETWYFSDDQAGTSESGIIDAEHFRTGTNSMELTGGKTAVLPAGHLKLPYFSLKFSILVSPGQEAEFRLQNMNGMYLKLVWPASGTGTLYVNDKPFSTFSFDHANWMDFEILAHARNNNIFIKAGPQLIMNETWKVPEGFICTESIEFSATGEGDSGTGSEKGLFLDDICVNSSASTGVETISDRGGQVKASPNPFADILDVTFGEPGSYAISIIDMTGREVYHQEMEAAINSPNRINLAHLSPGIYTLHTGGPGIKPLRIIRM